MNGIQIFVRLIVRDALRRRDRFDQLFFLHGDHVVELGFLLRHVAQFRHGQFSKLFNIHWKPPLTIEVLLAYLTGKVKMATKEKSSAKSAEATARLKKI